ncbi:hypothetical protein B0H14DRAFT_2577725 [Mycena olivaceomarginata]|nr:hypothetical protein B0H14DRAFT_2577725 [Mycena olivaceomarginata]
MDNEFRWGDQRGRSSREGEVKEDSQVNVSTSPRPTCRFDPAQFVPAALRSSAYLVPLLALLKRVACIPVQMRQNARAARSKCTRSLWGRQADMTRRRGGGAAIELRSTTIRWIKVTE